MTYDLAALPVTLADVEQARSLLSGVVRTTPMEGSRMLSERLGGPVWLKCENLQRAGSFKIRGAYHRLYRMSDDERARGVVAASAGNHAQGVALAAQMLGVRATVFMPQAAALPKLAATRAYGANVELGGETLGDAIVSAQEYAQRTGAIFVHPFDHTDVLAGQGTTGLEILDQRPDVQTVVVPTGGGGLLAGIAVAIKTLRPDVRIIGAQAAGAAAFPPSLAAHHPVTLDQVVTMADGIAVPRPSELSFQIVESLVDEVVTVSEDSLSRALLMLLERAKLVVEPAGAAAVAALTDAPEHFRAPVVAVLSGGNVDPLLLMRVLRQGMDAASRYLALRLSIRDTPGSLAHLLSLIGSLDANVVEVEHRRTGPHLGLQDVEVDLELETRGPAHAHEVLTCLREAGYPAGRRSQ